jgi:aldehyde dehydrogenase (NAD+)
VLKPSELAPRTAKAIAELVRDCFEEQLVTVVNGGADAAEALLREQFDKIFFTGSSRVG